MRQTAVKTRSAAGLVAPATTTLGAGILRPGQAATLPGQFLFDFNSPVLTARGQALVKALVQNLRGNEAVTCEGYTDYAGDRRHELQLSRQRSLVVCNALKAYGAQVQTSNQGFAGDKPVVIGGKATLRHENRRVVVVVNR
jgi:outer membrane protein OmpA-like peptidoglycan-associated protein